MSTKIVLAVSIAAAVALGWWLLRRRRSALGAEQPFPGWPQWEGELRYVQHSRDERMPERAITEFDIRCVLASGGNSQPSQKDPTRMEWVGATPDCRTLMVVTAQDGDALRVITTYWVDPKVTKITVPARRAWGLFDNLDRIKATGADISVSETDRRGNVVVTITSLIEPFRRDAVKAVEEIANTK